MLDFIKVDKLKYDSVVRVAVYSSEKSRSAIKEMILNKYSEDIIDFSRERIRLNYNSIVVELVFYSFNQSARGVRTHYAVIDLEEINKTRDYREVLECVTKPTLCLYNSIYKDKSEAVFSDHIRYI